MSRVLWLALGYLAGLNAVGMSHWNALSPREQMMGLTFAAVLTVAVFVDRYIAPAYVDGGPHE